MPGRHVLLLLRVLERRLLTGRGVGTEDQGSMAIAQDPSRSDMAGTAERATQRTWSHPATALGLLASSTMLGSALGAGVDRPDSVLPWLILILAIATGAAHATSL